MKKGRGDFPSPPCSYTPPHEVEPANTSSSQENIVTKDIEREENITLQSHEISPEKNIIQSSIKKHASHDTRANNSKRLEHQKSVIILGNSMTKLLNGWEMEKTIQCNCRIYVKTFSVIEVNLHLKELSKEKDVFLTQERLKLSILIEFNYI